MFTTLLPLHMGSGIVFWPGLLALIATIIVLKIFFRRGGLGPVRWAPQHRHPFGHVPSPEEAALATLAERLAKGEISPEEYLERSSVLRNTRTE